MSDNLTVQSTLLYLYLYLHLYLHLHLYLYFYLYLYRYLYLYLCSSLLYLIVLYSTILCFHHASTLLSSDTLDCTLLYYTMLPPYFHSALF